MSVFMRIVGSAITAVVLLAASGARAGTDADKTASGVIAGVAIGAFAATVLTPPQAVYVYPAPPYWYPEPSASYVYHRDAWQESPIPDDDESLDDSDE